MDTHTFPVTIAPEALSRLSYILQSKGAPDSHIRIGVKGGGCSGYQYIIKLDRGQIEGDFTFRHENLTVVCDPKSAQILQGATLDFTGNLMGGGLKFDNPNASRSCGCGSSFVLKA
jgi:iron-sulfur cluster assembly protein